MWSVTQAVINCMCVFRDTWNWGTIWRAVVPARTLSYFHLCVQILQRCIPDSSVSFPPKFDDDSPARTCKQYGGAGLSKGSKGWLFCKTPTMKSEENRSQLFFPHRSYILWSLRVRIQIKDFEHMKEKKNHSHDHFLNSSFSLETHEVHHTSHWLTDMISCFVVSVTKHISLITFVFHMYFEHTVRWAHWCTTTE